MAAQEPTIHQPNGSHVRVPAWKKLGLKLKFARELPERSSLRSEQPKEVNDKKRKREPLANEEAPNKKCVSFDATAKEHDGSSAKDLMKAWEAREEELWPYNLVIPESALPKQEKAKSKKPAQTAAKPAVNTGASSPHSALLYLDRYHSSRADWKFSKNKETWLQKHILSLDHIPSSYDPALRSYISGLQSQAAISRVRAATEEAIHQDQEQKPEQNGTTSEHESGMEDPVLRQKYYESALTRYKRQLEESIDKEMEEEEQEGLDEKSQRQLAKRKRAEMVMWSIGATDEQPESSPRNGLKRVKLDPKESEDVKKKRKNRTNVVEISSSEDESTSSSDSDSGDGSDSKSASATGSESDAESESGDEDSDDASGADSTAELTFRRGNARPSSQSGTEEETTSESGSSDDETSSEEEGSP